MRIRIIGILVTLISVLLISIVANLYSFNKLTNSDSEINQKNALLLEKKEEEILSLKENISSLNNQLKTKNESIENKNVNVETETEGEVHSISAPSMESLVNSAYKFVDFTYNINPENYLTAKQNASNYMTKEMVETLFSSNGIDGNLTTKIKDINVYVNSEEENQAVVHYNIELDYGNGYEEKLTAFSLLYFVEEDGVFKVSQIQAINEIGGV